MLIDLELTKISFFSNRLFLSFPFVLFYFLRSVFFSCFLFHIFLSVMLTSLSYFHRAVFGLCFFFDPFSLFLSWLLFPLAALPLVPDSFLMLLCFSLAFSLFFAFYLSTPIRFPIAGICVNTNNIVYSLST